VAFIKSIRDYVDALVNAGAGSDTLAAARHRAFIATRLLTSTVAVATLPLYLGARGAPGTFEMLVLMCLTLPLLAVYDVSRSGRLERAQAFSALAFTGVGCSVAAASGGLTSLAALWIALVPIEAAVSASRRVFTFAVAVAAAVLALLLSLQVLDLIPARAVQQELVALAVFTLAIHAGGIVMASRLLTRTTLDLLIAERKRYRLLADNMSEACTRHAHDGAVLYASPAAERLFAAPATELLGQGLYARVHEADRNIYAVALAEAASHRPATAEFRVRRGPSRGRLQQFVWVEMRCRPHTAEADIGTPREVIAFIRDISERKAQQRTLEEVGSEAAGIAERQTELLATLGHELRTPLNAIGGFSKVMADELQMPRDDVRWRSYARLIHEASTHMLAVVDAMLEVSRTGGQTGIVAAEPVDPAQMIRDCCAMLALDMRRAGIELILHVDQNVPCLVTDRRALRQILTNVLSNAIKFTDRGGRIIVRAHAESGGLHIEVEDTGIGIAHEYLPRIFEPYFQADNKNGRRGQGRGLGLAIVKSLVTLLGGELAIASRPEKGTRVTMRLPFAPPSRRADAPRVGINGVSARQTAEPPAVAIVNSRVKQSA
jgi:cell cycle sensor histidine kinase DivJ